MTGPEFAAAHGSDSSTWMPADFDTEVVLAEIDAFQAGRAARAARRRAAAIRNAIYVLHTALFLAAGYGAYLATSPVLPVIPVVDASAAWFAATLTSIAVCFALDPAVAKLLRALGAQPTDPSTPAA